MNNNLEHNIEFISTIKFDYVSLLHQFTNLPFKEKCFASRKGKPQDLHQIQ